MIEPGVSSRKTNRRHAASSMSGASTPKKSFSRKAGSLFGRRAARRIAATGMARSAAKAARKPDGIPTVKIPVRIIGPMAQNRSSADRQNKTFQDQKTTPDSRRIISIPPVFEQIGDMAAHPGKQRAR